MISSEQKPEVRPFITGCVLPGTECTPAGENPFQIVELKIADEINQDLIMLKLELQRFIEPMADSITEITTGEKDKKTHPLTVNNSLRNKNLLAAGASLLALGKMTVQGFLGKVELNPSSQEVNPQVASGDNIIQKNAEQVQISLTPEQQQEQQVNLFLTLSDGNSIQTFKESSLNPDYEQLAKQIKDAAGPLMLKSFGDSNDFFEPFIVSIPVTMDNGIATPTATGGDGNTIRALVMNKNLDKGVNGLLFDYNKGNGTAQNSIPVDFNILAGEVGVPAVSFLPENPLNISVGLNQDKLVVGGGSDMIASLTFGDGSNKWGVEQKFVNGKFEPVVNNLPSFVAINDEVTAKLNARTGPGTSFPVDGQVDKSIPLTYLGEDKDVDGQVWYHVSYPDGNGNVKTEWVSGAFTKVNKTTNQPVENIPPVESLGGTLMNADSLKLVEGGDWKYGVETQINGHFVRIVTDIVDPSTGLKLDIQGFDGNKLDDLLRKVGVVIMGDNTIRIRDIEDWKKNKSELSKDTYLEATVNGAVDEAYLYPKFDPQNGSNITYDIYVSRHTLLGYNIISKNGNDIRDFYLSNAIYTAMIKSIVPLNTSSYDKLQELIDSKIIETPYFLKVDLGIPPTQY